MNNSNTTVTPKGLNPSAATAKSGKGKSNKDATKATAKDLIGIVLSSREDKTSPSKAVNAFNKRIADLLSSNALSNEEKLASVKAWQSEAIAEATAAIERHAFRAMRLSHISRGTTGKCGIHQSDVVTELFGSGSKATARDNNTDALKRAGKLPH